MWKQIYVVFNETWELFKKGVIELSVSERVCVACFWNWSRIDRGGRRKKREREKRKFIIDTNLVKRLVRNINKKMYAIYIISIYLLYIHDVYYIIIHIYSINIHISLEWGMSVVVNFKNYLCMWGAGRRVFNNSRYSI